MRAGTATRAKALMRAREMTIVALVGEAPGARSGAAGCALAPGRTRPQVLVRATWPKSSRQFVPADEEEEKSVDARAFSKRHRSGARRAV